MLRPTPTLVAAGTAFLEHLHVITEALAKVLPAGTPSWVTELIHVAAELALLPLALLTLWHLIKWLGKLANFIGICLSKTGDALIALHERIGALADRGRLEAKRFLRWLSRRL